jgi:putative transposase
VPETEARVLKAKVRELAVRSTNDQALLTSIRGITDQRATYGYRRVAALLRQAADPVAANPKRVYRVMREAKLSNGSATRDRPTRPT